MLDTRPVVAMTTRTQLASSAAVTTPDAYAQYALARCALALDIRDKAYDLVGQVAAAMQAQTAATTLMLKFGTELVCACTGFSQKGLRSLSRAKQRELHQTVSDGMANRHPYSSGLIDQITQHLVFYLGQRSTGVLNNKIGQMAAAFVVSLLAILPANTIVKKKNGKITHLSWMQGDDHHTIAINTKSIGKNKSLGRECDFIHRINDQIAAMAEFKSGGDRAAVSEQFASALDKLRSARSDDETLKIAFVMRSISRETIDVCAEKDVALFEIDAVTEFHRWLVG